MELTNERWFKKLDLFLGFYQIRVYPKCRNFTAFGFESDLFEWVELLMGLTNAPASFQRIMNNLFEFFILSGFVIIYLDDILIYSR
jgi:hypothetical protein